MTTPLIQFVCIKPEHRPRTLTAQSSLTIHEGGWAYCPHGAGEGHAWHRIVPLKRDSAMAARRKES
jgi:hypothetical protein